MSGGLGKNYIYTDFFTFTPIAGCILSCSYGDTCGNPLTGTDVVVTSPIDPWVINASITSIIGYSKTLCL